MALSERHAEVAVLQSELQDSKTRMHLVAAASDSAQTDYNVALARSNELYAQELQHLQGLLQVSRAVMARQQTRLGYCRKSCDPGCSCLHVGQTACM